MNLFSKTWVNDLEWIELAIYSVLRHCKEPVNWYMAIERMDRARLDHVISRAQENFKDKRKDDHFQTFDSELVWPESQNIVDGYMRQQWIKMNVHKLVHDHLIYNWDSDTLALRDFDTSTFFRSGKPVWWWDDMNHLINGGYPADRKQLLMNIFGGDCGREYMRCMPIPLLGKALAHGAGTDIWKKAFDMCTSGNRTFTEFNVIGEFCSRNFSDEFIWINAQNDGPTWQGEANDPTKITTQCWSWGGVNDGIRKLVTG